MPSDYLQQVGASSATTERIWAESEPGKGAMFRFTLPVGADAAAEVPAGAEPPTKTRFLSAGEARITQLHGSGEPPLFWRPLRR
jgi:hypothetical protein